MNPAGAATAEYTSRRMLIDDPRAMARSCRTTRDAAHAACALETEISLSEGRDELWYDDAEDALMWLRERFPGFWKLDAYKMPPSLSGAARRTERVGDIEVITPVPSRKAPKPIEKPRKRHPVLALFAVLCLVGFAVSAISGHHATTTQGHYVAALSPAWAEFHQTCIAGSAPGEGTNGASCRCWEAHLAAAKIFPGYALGALDAATIGGGQAFTIAENVGNVVIRQAMDGCRLYPEAGSE